MGTAGSWHSRDWMLGAYTGPTKYRKQWVFAALVGYGWKMVRIEIYQENDALYAVTIDCANDHSQEASEYTSVNGDGLLNDLSAIPKPVQCVARRRSHVSHRSPSVSKLQRYDEQNPQPRSSLLRSRGRHASVAQWIRTIYTTLEIEE